MLRSFTLCYSPPFDVILRSACQWCLEIRKKFSVLEQIVLVFYWTLSECQAAACSTGSARTQRKTAPTESVSVGARHDQVAVVSRAKSRSMLICASLYANLVYHFRVSIDKQSCWSTVTLTAKGRSRCMHRCIYYQRFHYEKVWCIFCVLWSWGYGNRRGPTRWFLDEFCFAFHMRVLGLKIFARLTNSFS